MATGVSPQAKRGISCESRLPTPLLAGRHDVTIRVTHILAGAVPSSVGRRFAARRAHRPRELCRAVGTARASGERVEGASAAIGPAGPLHSNSWREGAGRTSDTPPNLAPS